MRVTNDVLSGLLRPPAPQPKQPTSRERALANRLRVLRTVAEVVVPAPVSETSAAG